MGGSWDCHCALCCGPLNICCVHIGEGDGDQGKAGGPDNSSISEDSYCEERPYSSSLVSEESTKWIHQCRALCFDSSNEAVFISGVGHYDDYGYFEVREPGNDPHDTNPDMYHCYEDSGEWEVLTFPFHEACYRVLAERLGYKKSSEIDTYALYKVFKQYNDSAYELGLDYGGVKTEQTWDSRRGEEYLVCSPDDGGVELKDTIWSLVPSRLLLAEPSPDLSHRVTHDPFSAVPPDLLQEILSYLSVHDALNLMQASQHICSNTREPQYWAEMIGFHLAPWFWEIDDLVAEQNFVDYKGLFLWLDAVTQPRKGVEGPWMGLANRRRIWGVCEQLADAYRVALNQEIVERGVMSDHEEGEEGAGT